MAVPALPDSTLLVDIPKLAGKHTERFEVADAVDDSSSAATKAVLMTSLAKAAAGNATGADLLFWLAVLYTPSTAEPVSTIVVADDGSDSDTDTESSSDSSGDEILLDAGSNTHSEEDPTFEVERAALLATTWRLRANELLEGFSDFKRASALWFMLEQHLRDGFEADVETLLEDEKFNYTFLFANATVRDKIYAADFSNEDGATTTNLAKFALEHNKKFAKQFLLHMPAEATNKITVGTRIHPEAATNYRRQAGHWKGKLAMAIASVGSWGAWLAGALFDFVPDKHLVDTLQWGGPEPSIVTNPDFDPIKFPEPEPTGFAPRTPAAGGKPISGYPATGPAMTPRRTPSGVASPGVDSPGVDSPGVASPGVASPPNSILPNNDFLILLEEAASPANTRVRPNSRIVDITGLGSPAAMYRDSGRGRRSVDPVRRSLLAFPSPGGGEGGDSD